MPPGGGSMLRKSFSEKRADFSVTRCFSMPSSELNMRLATMATSTNTTKTASSTVMTVVDARPAKTEDADSSNSIRSHSKENDQQPTEAVCATDQQQRHSQTGLGDDFTHKQWQQSEEQSSTTSSSSRSSSRSSSLNSIAPELSAIGAANINSPTTTTTPPTTDNVKRQFFWRNIVKQFNFTDEQERKLLISLTHGIEWMNMKTLPKAFIQRHREIFYLVRDGAIMYIHTRLLLSMLKVHVCLSLDLHTRLSAIRDDSARCDAHVQYFRAKPSPR